MLRGRHAGNAATTARLTGDYEIMLLTMDIIVVDQIQTYAKRLKAYCEEHGLYRQEVKKSVNTICKIIDRLYHLVLEADEIKFAPMWRHSFPHFVDDYLADGGGMVTKLQVAYRERWNDEVQKLYWAERQVTSYNHAEQGELLSMAYVIMMVSQIAERISERITVESFSEVAVVDGADTFDVMANMLPLSDTPSALNRVRKIFFDKMFIE